MSTTELPPDDRELRGAILAYVAKYHPVPGNAVPKGLADQFEVKQPASAHGTYSTTGGFGPRSYSYDLGSPPDDGLSSEDRERVFDLVANLETDGYLRRGFGDQASKLIATAKGREAAKQGGPV